MTTPKTFKDYATKKSTLLTELLGLALDVFQQPDHDIKFLSLTKLIVRFCGYSQWLSLDFHPDGTPKERPPKKPRSHCVLRINKTDDGFFCKLIVFITKSNKLIVFQSVPCVTIEEATLLGEQWAEANGMTIVRDPHVRFESECNFERDRAKLEAMRLTCSNGVTAIVLKGGKASPEVIESLIFACWIPIQHFHNFEAEFKKRWNASGVWIGPVKKKRKPKPIESPMAEESSP